MESIILVSGDNQLNKNISRYLDEYDRFETTIFTSTKGLIESIYDTPPSLIVMDNAINLKSYIEMIRSDPIFNNLPIVILLAKGNFIKDWEEYPIDDFIFKPVKKNDFIMRISLSIQRSRRAVEINPLTMLPGNTPIIKKVQTLLDKSEQFAIAYADLDNFKPYNDKYGFSRGDEIIRMTSRLITNIVKTYDPKNCFVGHIGGDDFVFIASPDKIGKISEEIIRNFDDIVPSFYDKEDREQGYITSFSRDGKKKTFPLLTISIGISINRGWFRHYGEISASVANVKKYAKSCSGSVYKIERRDYTKKDS